MVSSSGGLSRPVIFGCPVDRLTMEEAVRRVEAMIRARAPSRLAAVNAAKYMLMDRDRRLFEAVSGCELILADGVGVTFASWLLTGIRLRRVTGIDLMEKLLAVAAERGYRVFFLGAKEEVLQAMLAELEVRHPGLGVAGVQHGYFKPEEETAIVERIRQSGADLLFVGMGTPAKELWIDRHFRDTGVPVSMGVGGSFDVISGHVRRAPAWVQRAGLEWFYRFVQEPRRLWRRYFVTSAEFILKVLIAALRRPFTPTRAA